MILAPSPGTVADRGDAEVKAHLRGFAKIPAELRSAMAASGADLYFGPGPATDLDHLQALARQEAAGYDRGDVVGKVHALTYWAPPDADHPHRHAVMAIGGARGTYSDGSVNVSAHESGHVLDSGGAVSGSAEFGELYDLATGTFGDRMNPYFLQPGGKGQREFMAETFAAWVEHRDQPEATRARAIAMVVDSIPVRHRTPQPGDAELFAASARIGTGLGRIYDRMAAAEKTRRG